MTESSSGPELDNRPTERLGPKTEDELSSAPSPEGERIGAFQLLRLLGEGGMGRVYLAEQHEPVHRRVALKLIASPLAGRQARLRFETEQQALARLSHPHIAQMYEAGTTQDGRPFFAMELVDGEPITVFCNRRKLSLHQRLELLVDVCEGVNHAHQKGILHRDLKPSNLLVTEIENRPVVKIIDFGVAKAIDQPLIEATLLTGDRIVGTPAFLPPEAFEIDGEGVDLDTRADVYSIGILLYELLVGAHPFEVENESLYQLIRRITEGEVRGPSSLWANLDPTQKEGLARQRGHDARSLERRLQGDLDWIALEAIARERENRYGSPAELAKDIRRHLVHEPVSASPPSPFYRIKKFVRRRRGLVAMAALLLVSLLFGVAGTTLGLLRARDQAAVALEARGDAEDLMELMLEDVYEGLEPLGRLDLLARVATRSLGYYEGQEGVSSSAESRLRRARTFRNMGNVLKLEGRPDEALQALRRYQEIARAHLGDDQVGTQAQLDMVRSSLAIGEIYLGRGEYDEAIRLHREALAGARQAVELRIDEDESPDLLWESLAYLGWTLRDHRQYEEAASVLSETLELARQRAQQQPGNTDLEHYLAMSLAFQGLLNQETGALEEASRRLEEALEITRKLTTKTPGDLLLRFELVLNHTRLAATELLREDLKTSEHLYRQAVQLGQDLVGRDPRNTQWARELAFAHSELAYIAREQGRFDLALTEMSASLAISRRLAALDPTHTASAADLAWDLLETGRNQAALGSTGEARDLWEEGLAVITPISQEAAEDYTQSIQAQLLLLLGQTEEAKPIVVRLRESGLGDPDLDELAKRFGL